MCSQVHKNWAGKGQGMKSPCVLFPAGEFCLINKLSLVQGIRGGEIITYLQEGKRLEAPDDCPQTV